MAKKKAAPAKSKPAAKATTKSKPKLDPRVDAYIEQKAGFAQPILIKVRKLIHKAAPQIVENIKWGAISFEHQGIVLIVAAFKAHVNIVFPKAPLMSDPQKFFAKLNGPMPALQPKNIEELPKDTILLAYFKEAVAINERGEKIARVKKPKPKVNIPADLQAALNRVAKARDAFANFSESCQREYVQWIIEAKQEETRQRRIATTVEWAAEGKTRNWKYKNC